MTQHDRASPLYKEAFENYLRYGTPIFASLIPKNFLFLENFMANEIVLFCERVLIGLGCISALLLIFLIIPELTRIHSVACPYSWSHDKTAALENGLILKCDPDWGGFILIDKEGKVVVESSIKHFRSTTDTVYGYRKTPQVRASLFHLQTWHRVPHNPKSHRYPIKKNHD